MKILLMWRKRRLFSWTSGYVILFLWLCVLKYIMYSVQYIYTSFHISKKSKDLWGSKSLDSISWDQIQTGAHVKRFPWSLYIILDIRVLYLRNTRYSKFRKQSRPSSSYNKYFFITKYTFSHILWIWSKFGTCIKI